MCEALQIRCLWRKDGCLTLSFLLEEFVISLLCYVSWCHWISCQVVFLLQTLVDVAVFLFSLSVYSSSRQRIGKLTENKLILFIVHKVVYLFYKRISNEPTNCKQHNIRTTNELIQVDRRIVSVHWHIPVVLESSHWEKGNKTSLQHCPTRNTTRREEFPHQFLSEYVERCNRQGKQAHSTSRKTKQKWKRSSTNCIKLEDSATRFECATHQQLTLSRESLPRTMKVEETEEQTRKTDKLVSYLK